MSRGLGFGKVIEYHCEYMEKEESLGSDVAQIYAHVDGCLEEIEIIIPEQSLLTWYKYGQSTPAPHPKQLYYAVRLCNGFHTARQKARVTYTVKGMKIMNKCSLLLNATLTDNSDAHDLV
ncbi:hypothetical protein EX30DRAFT_348810 [Ascodesmis nigricans]|uniref:Uncharacterized protein n=1 Tax=Ascodesmis nigricans TaxID=341454 RepID=A0A4V3SIT1_9PEZI|nr:hypothetical protein EX30DRAFT_348810 [Ascodesmis nigricans]